MTETEWVTRSSVLEHVEIFRRGAEITRRVSLAASDRRVRIESLPLELDDGSVRVELLDPTRATVRGLRVSLDVSSDETAPLHVETDALRDLRRRLREIALELEACNAEHTRAAAIAIPERPARDHGRPPPPAPDRARLELLELRFTLQREARERASALHEEKLELERTLRTLVDSQRRRSSDTPILHRVRKAIDLELAEVSHAGVVRLLYRVRSARWAPSYRLAFDTRTKKARLELRAAIAQRTGEDWRGAQVSVSTARMDGWYDLPELRSLRIGRAQPPPKRAYRPLPADGAALFADHDRAFAALERQAPRDRLERVAAPLAQAAEVMPSPPPPGAAPMAGGPPMQAFGAATGAPMPMAPAPAAPMPRAAKAAAGPVPTMSMAMPARQAAEGAKRGGLMANLLGGLGGGGAPPRNSPSEAFEDGVAFEELEAKMAPHDVGFQSLLPASAGAPARDLLDFGRLRLDAPSEGRRGVLRALSIDQLGAEAGRDLRDFQAAVGAMRAIDSEMSSLSAPALHTYPESLYGFDHRYDAGGTIDVPSDGAFHSVAITEAEGPASMLHVSVPREDPAVFRTLELVSPLGGPVMLGPVDVYLDGSLLVSSSVGPSPTNGKLEVGMGVDESVKVARNVRFREESAGLMGGSSSLVHDIEIEVQNASAAAIRLEIRERIPVIAKGEEDIEVRPGKTSPPWHETPPDDPTLEGGKRWVLDIAAGAEATLATEYAIRISAKNELVGGNRRD